tara:strand:- start:58 stop:231 length:174 start_codon:yes stop_codon:yes gene_type:complete
MNTTETYEYLVDNGIATDDEIILVTNINGYNLESLNAILFVRTGCNDLEQALEMEGL